MIGNYFSGKARSSLAGLQVSARNFGGFLFISLAGWVALVSPRAPFAIYALALLFLQFMWWSIIEPIRSVEPAKGQHGVSETPSRPSEKAVLDSTACRDGVAFGHGVH